MTPGDTPHRTTAVLLLTNGSHSWKVRTISSVACHLVGSRHRSIWISDAIGMISLDFLRQEIVTFSHYGIDMIINSLNLNLLLGLPPEGRS